MRVCLLTEKQLSISLTALSCGLQKRPPQTLLMLVAVCAMVW